MQCREARALLSAGLYSDAPWALYNIPLVLLAGFMAFKGLRSLGRVAELVVPVVLIAFAAALCFGAGRLDFGRLLPILPDGAAPIAHAVTNGVFWLGESLILLTAAGRVKRGKNFVRVSAAAYTVSALAVTAVTALFLTAAGGTVGYVEFGHAPNALLDFSFSGNMNGLGGFVVALYFSAVVLKTAVTVWAAGECLSRALNLKSGFAAIAVTAVLVYLIDNVFAPSTGSAVFFVTRYAPYVLPPVELIIPAVCAVCAAVYRKRAGAER
jgi:hypothetical protein